MKLNLFIKISLAGLVASQVSFAAGPIIWTDTTFIKKNISSNVDLLMSTNAEHDGQYFTARTLFFLGDEVNNLSLQKQVRNEICASDAIFREASNRLLDASFLPGSMGVYNHYGEIKAISDTGLTGKSLSIVLRELSKLPEDKKIPKAIYYAVNMAQIIIEIHRAGILWNDFDIGNFYVRPDGKLYAYDFSFAKKASNGAAGTAEKNVEIRKFVLGPILQMYNQMFRTQKPYDKLTAALGLPPHDPGLNENQLKNGLLAAAAAFLAWDDLAVTVYLDNTNNKPYLPGAIKLSPLIIADHARAAMDNLVVLDAAVPALLIDPAVPGGATVFAADRVQLNDNANTRPNNFCSDWTGNE